MSTIDLSQYGIKNVKEVIYNPSYEQLFQDETDPSLQGFEKGVVTDLGAVNVMTGFAWAAVLAMPFALVTNALEGYGHMGVYLGLDRKSTRLNSSHLA